jgi:two-component system sensor histidine kinase KdpD
MVLTLTREKRILWLMDDITQLIEAEDEIRRLNNNLEERVRQRTAELEAALAHKDDFLGLMSHELRTPLTVLLGGTRILSRKPDKMSDEDKASVLKDIVEAGERLEQLIENLMTLARQQGREINLEPLLIQHAVIGAAEEFRGLHSEMRLAVSLADDLPPVLGSSMFIRQVMLNLLSNARKYSGSRQPIEVSARRFLGHIVVSVRDYGPGLDPADAQHVFESFYRSDRVQTGTPGAGLGLSVCKRLMEAQCGRIWTTPVRGQGALFAFALPVVAEASPEEPGLSP